MPGPIASFDLIRELRLRNWARQHYVPRSQRGRNWHPIVLEEMAFRDAELAEQPGEYRPSAYVPLEPMETYYIDPPHASVPTPKLITAVANPVSSDVLFVG